MYDARAVIECVKSIKLNEMESFCGEKGMPPPLAFSFFVSQHDAFEATPTTSSTARQEVNARPFGVAFVGYAWV